MRRVTGENLFHDYTYFDKSLQSFVRVIIIKII